MYFIVNKLDPKIIIIIIIIFFSDNRLREKNINLPQRTQVCHFKTTCTI